MKKWQNIVYIECCHHCDTHNWCTRHDEAKYRSTYEAVCNAILARHPDLQVVLNQIPKNLAPLKKDASDNKYYDSITKKCIYFPELGAFEVSFNGVLVFSKHESQAWPEPQQVANLLSSVVEQHEKTGNIDKFLKFSKSNSGNTEESIDANLKEQLDAFMEGDKLMKELDIDKAFPMSLAQYERSKNATTTKKAKKRLFKNKMFRENFKDVDQQLAAQEQKHQDDLQNEGAGEKKKNDTNKNITDSKQLEKMLVFNSNFDNKTEKNFLPYPIQQQEDVSKNKNNMVFTLDDRETFYGNNASKARGSMNFTLTDHFKMYKSQPKNPNGNSSNNPYTSHLPKTNSSTINNRQTPPMQRRLQETGNQKINSLKKEISSLTSLNQLKRQQLDNTYSMKIPELISESKYKNNEILMKLPQFIKKKGVFKEEYGEREMIIRLDNIEEENPASSEDQEVIIEKSKKNPTGIMKEWDKELERLEDRFEKFQQKVQIIKQKKKEFQDGHRINDNALLALLRSASPNDQMGSEDDFLNNPLLQNQQSINSSGKKSRGLDRVEMIERVYAPFGRDVNGKQNNSFKKSPEDYFSIGEEQRNEKLKRIYGKRKANVQMRDSSNPILRSRKDRKTLDEQDGEENPLGGGDSKHDSVTKDNRANRDHERHKGYDHETPSSNAFDLEVNPGTVTEIQRQKQLNGTTQSFNPDPRKSHLKQNNFRRTTDDLKRLKQPNQNSTSLPKKVLQNKQTRGESKRIEEQEQDDRLFTKSFRKASKNKKNQEDGVENKTESEDDGEESEKAVLRLNRKNHADYDQLIDADNKRPTSKNSKQGGSIIKTDHFKIQKKSNNTVAVVNNNSSSNNNNKPANIGINRKSQPGILKSKNVLQIDSEVDRKDNNGSSTKKTGSNHQNLNNKNYMINRKRKSEGNHQLHEGQQVEDEDNSEADHKENQDEKESKADEQEIKTDPKKGKAANNLMRNTQQRIGEGSRDKSKNQNANSQSKSVPKNIGRTADKVGVINKQNQKKTGDKTHQVAGKQQELEQEDEENIENDAEEEDVEQKNEDQSGENQTGASKSQKKAQNKLQNNKNTVQKNSREMSTTKTNNLSKPNTKETSNSKPKDIVKGKTEHKNNPNKDQTKKQRHETQQNGKDQEEEEEVENEAGREETEQSQKDVQNGKMGNIAKKPDTAGTSKTDNVQKAANKKQTKTDNTRKSVTNNIQQKTQQQKKSTGPQKSSNNPNKLQSPHQSVSADKQAQDDQDADQIDEQDNESVEPGAPIITKKSNKKAQGSPDKDSTSLNKDNSNPKMNTTKSSFKPNSTGNNLNNKTVKKDNGKEKSKNEKEDHQEEQNNVQDHSEEQNMEQEDKATNLNQENKRGSGKSPTKNNQQQTKGKNEESSKIVKKSDVKENKSISKNTSQEPNKQKIDTAKQKRESTATKDNTAKKDDKAKKSENKTEKKTINKKQPAKDRTKKEGEPNEEEESVNHEGSEDEEQQEEQDVVQVETVDENGQVVKSESKPKRSGKNVKLSETQKAGEATKADKSTKDQKERSGSNTSKMNKTGTNGFKDAGDAVKDTKKQEGKQGSIDKDEPGKKQTKGEGKKKAGEKKKQVTQKKTKTQEEGREDNQKQEDAQESEGNQIESENEDAADVQQNGNSEQATDENGLKVQKKDGKKGDQNKKGIQKQSQKTTEKGKDNPKKTDKNKAVSDTLNTQQGHQEQEQAGEHSHDAQEKQQSQVNKNQGGAEGSTSVIKSPSKVNPKKKQQKGNKQNEAVSKQDNNSTSSPQPKEGDPVKTLSGDAEKSSANLKAEGQASPKKQTSKDQTKENTQPSITAAVVINNQIKGTEEAVKGKAQQHIEKTLNTSKGENTSTPQQETNAQNSKSPKSVKAGDKQESKVQKQQINQTPKTPSNKKEADKEAQQTAAQQPHHAEKESQLESQLPDNDEDLRKSPITIITNQNQNSPKEGARLNTAQKEDKRNQNLTKLENTNDNFQQEAVTGENNVITKSAKPSARKPGVVTSEIGIQMDAGIDYCMQTGDYFMSNNSSNIQIKRAEDEKKMKNSTSRSEFGFEVIDLDQKRAPILSNIYALDKISQEEMIRYTNYIAKCNTLTAQFLDPDFKAGTAQKLASKPLRQIYSNALLFSKPLNPDALTLPQKRSENLGLVLKVLCQRDEYLVTRLFEKNKLAKHGLCGLWLNWGGRWRSVIIDELLPVDPKTNAPAYLNASDECVWALLIEKAIAKLCGGYEAMDNLSVGELFKTLTGSNYVSFRIKEDPTQNDKCLRYVLENEKKNFVLHCERYRKQPAHENTTKISPVYTVHNAQSVNDNKNRLIQLKTDKDAEPFWMKFEVFCEQFRHINVLHLRQNYVSAAINVRLVPKAYSVIEALVPSLSMGTITLTHCDGPTYSTRIMLYREEDKNLLRFVGMAKEKNKKTIFFDCQLLKGRYYLFLESEKDTVNSVLTYSGEERVQYREVETIENETMKNGNNEYIPVNNNAANTNKEYSNAPPKTMLNPFDPDNHGPFLSNSRFTTTSNNFNNTNGKRSNKEQSKINKIRSQFIDYLLKGDGAARGEEQPENNS